MGETEIAIRYEHQNNSNYLVIEDGVEYDDYQYKMLKRNKPEHFLKFSSYSVNGRYGIYYDITSRQQMSKFYEYGKMNMEDVKSICVNVSEAVRIAEDYMLDLDYVKVEPKYIYIDIGTRKMWFVYHTRVNNITFGEGLKILFEFILEHFDHSLEKEYIVKLYEVYQKIIIGDYDPFNLLKLFDGIGVGNNNIVENESESKEEKRVIERAIEKEIETVMPEEVVVETEVRADISKACRYIQLIGIIAVVTGVINLFFSEIMPFKMPFGMTVVFIIAGLAIISFSGKMKVRAKHADSKMVTSKKEIPYKTQIKSNHTEGLRRHDEIKPDMKNGGESEDVCNDTILLSDFTNVHAKALKLKLLEEELIGDAIILKKGTQNIIKEIQTDKYPYVIGSLENMADFIIKAQVISRMHCCIYQEEYSGDKYMIEDLNSTNGTFLNGERLNGHEKRLLQNNDTIRLAAISFKVEIS